MEGLGVILLPSCRSPSPLKVPHFIVHISRALACALPILPLPFMPLPLTLEGTAFMTPIHINLRIDVLTEAKETLEEHASCILRGTTGETTDAVQRGPYRDQTAINCFIYKDDKKIFQTILKVYSI